VSKHLAVVPATPQSDRPAPLPLLVTVKECARLLSVDESTVRHLARQGELRYRKLSERKWLIQLRSVREFASKVVAA
jgi:excisionase family DNA binding protein